MKQFYFLLLISQIFIVLVFLGPLLSLGSYKLQREQPQLEAREALKKASSNQEKLFTRVVTSVGVVVLALNIWPAKASICHICISFILIIAIR